MFSVLHTWTPPWPTFSHPTHTYTPPHPSHSYKYTYMHVCTHIHISPLLFLLSTLHPFYPPSQTHHPSSSTAPIPHLSHAHWKKKKKHTGAGWPWDRIWWWWFIGVSVMGQRLALGWMDTLDWANKAHMDLLDDRLTGQAAGRRAKWLTGQVGCRAGLGTDPVHRVVHHKTDTVITVTEVKLARTW